MAVSSSTRPDDLIARLTSLQADAWKRLGVSPAERKRRLDVRRQNYVDLDATAPGYFNFDWGLPPSVAARSGLVGNLEELLSIRPVTDLQDPVLQAWLDMVWRYTGVHLPFESDFVQRVVLASAPTGEFNATALSGGAAGAIVVEEGLVRLARRVCALMAPLLFREDQGRILVHTKAEVDARISADETPAWDLAQVFVDLLAADEIPLPEPVLGDRSLVERYADTLFQSFIAFVLWHETFHLEVGAGNPETMNQAAAMADAETMAAVLRRKTTFKHIEWDDADLRRAFVRQREEAEADTYAMIRVAAYGSRTGSLPGNVTGAAIFMMALETVHRMLTQLSDAALFEAELNSDIGDLTAAALIGGQHHPHPRVRRAEVVDVISKLNQGVGGMVGFEFDRTRIIFDRVWPLVGASIVVGDEAIRDRAGRWRRPAADATDAMTRALTASL